MADFETAQASPDVMVDEEQTDQEPCRKCGGDGKVAEEAVCPRCLGWGLEKRDWDGY